MTGFHRRARHGGIVSIARLFQRCPTLRTFQEGDVSRLSEDAGPINGTYCRRYRDAAVATRASFNENPWELMRNNNR